MIEVGSEDGWGRDGPSFGCGDGSTERAVPIDGTAGVVVVVVVVGGSSNLSIVVVVVIDRNSSARSWPSVVVRAAGTASDAGGTDVDDAVDDDDSSFIGTEGCCFLEQCRVVCSSAFQTNKLSDESACCWIHVGCGPARSLWDWYRTENPMNGVGSPLAAVICCVLCFGLRSSVAAKRVWHCFESIKSNAKKYLLTTDRTFPNEFDSIRVNCSSRACVVYGCMEHGAHISLALPDDTVPYPSPVRSSIAHQHMAFSKK